MPLPLIIGAAALVIAAGGGTAGALARHKAKPQQVLLVGPRGAGKTTLAALLGDDSAAMATVPTQERKKFTFDFEWLPGKGPRLDVVDTPGGSSAQEAIRDLAPKSSLVCLVVALKQPNGTGTADNPVRLAKQIRKCAGKRTATMLLVTHEHLPSENRFTKHPELDPIIDALGPNAVVQTNLLDSAERERVAHALADALA